MRTDNDANHTHAPAREIRFRQNGLIHKSDIELWLVPRKWKTGTVTLPVYCVRAENAAGQRKLVFWAACHLPGSVQSSLLAWRDSLSMDVTGELWVHSGWDMPEGLTRAPGVTPMYYVPAEFHPTDDEVISDDFPMEVWKASGIADRAVFLAVWTAMVSTIPKWLVAHRKPVDFGFFKLVAVPLRAAWKTHMLSAFPTLGALLKGNGWDAVGPSVSHASLTEVVEGESGHIAGWNIEVLLGSRWSRYTRLVETKRLMAFPGESYIRQIGGIIHGLKDQLVEILAQADAKADLPSGSIIVDPAIGGKRLAPRTSTNSRGPVPSDRIPLPCDGRNLPGGFASGSGESVAPAKTSGVRSMSFVSPAKANMRHTWDPLHGRTRGK